MKTGFLFFFLALFYINIKAEAQSLNVNTCAMLDKRSNGNGQASLAAGIFPGYGQNNPVAANVVGTSYQTVPYDPATKTGDFHFYWSSATAIVYVPVINRVWITPNGSSTAVLSPIRFGPPIPPVPSGNKYYVDYAFYVQNMPPAGKVTLEFVDPQTNMVAFTCTYDLQSNGSTTTSFDCSPTITTQPANQSICGASTATFTVVASGIQTMKWQVSSDNANWTDVSGADYSGITTTTLAIANPPAYDGKYYRAVLTGSSGTCISYSSSALLVAKPKPTAVFANTSLCGTGLQSLAINLTGTAPWSVTYSNGTPVTVSNITTSPFYIPVSGSSPYTITSVSDAWCTNSSPSGNVTATLYANPTVTPTNANACYGSSSFSVAFSVTGSPDKYSITPGVRALGSFANVTNAPLGASPVSVSIPASAAAGTYDFNLTVSNSVTGCVSAVVPFTLTVAAPLSVTATAGSGSVCAGTAVTLTAAPSGLASYEWTIQPSNTVLGTGLTYSPTVNANTTYTVKATTAAGCYATADVTVTAVAGPTLSITPASPSICSGNAVTLSASGGNTYAWSPATGLSATSGNVVVATPSTTTTYTITSQNITGCQSVGTVTVTVNTPVITVTPSATICSGGIKTLTASGGATYNWYPATGLYTDASATVAYVTGNSATTVYAKPNSTTTYYVNGTTAGGCSAIAGTTVTISPAPINAATSTAKTLIFCAQLTTTFPLDVVMTEAISSASWSYSTDGVTYTGFSSATALAGVTLTPTTFGSSPTVKYTCTLSNYGNSNYSGPRYFRLTIVGSSCTYLYDIFITDTKASPVAPAPVPNQSTICSGNSVTLTVGNLASGTSAQWQTSNDNTNWTNTGAGITGPSICSLTASPVANTYYRVVYNGGNGNCGSTSSSTMVTVAGAMGANTVSPSTTCSSVSGSIALTGSAITSGIYQWQFSTTSSSSGFSDVLGATSQSYTLPTNIVAVPTWYRRIASTSTCSTGTSSAVSVYPPIANNQITNAVASYCTSAPSTTLTGTVPVGGSGAYTYQWSQSTDGTSFTAISGATAQDYTTPSQTQTVWYKRTVSSGGCSGESSTYKMTVNANPTITVTAGSSTCAGTAVILTASGGVTYSWSPSTELSATTGPAITATATATRTYTVTGTDGNGCTNTASSTITVTALPDAPTLTASSQTICSGSVSLTSKIATGTAPEWFTAPEPKPAYAVANPAAVTTAGKYYAFSKNGSCYSASYATFTLSVDDVSAPVVAATSLVYCSPATANLVALQPSAAAGITLEWHTAATNPAAGNLVGTPSAVGTGTYYLYAKSDAGGCYGPASAAVTVTINTTPSATTLNSSALSACAPGSVDLNTTYSASGGNTYKWYSSNSPSPATLVAVPSAVAMSGDYYLVATANNCAGPVSSKVTVTINPKPTATISVPAVACASATANTAITATSSAGESGTYSWETLQADGVSWSALTDGAVYSGTGTKTLTVINNTGLGGKYYRFTVTGSGSCSTTSEAAILLVDPSTITLTNQPVSVSIKKNNDTSFSLTANDPTALYQWKVSTNGGGTYSNITDNSVYGGSTSPTLNLVNMPLSYTGYKYQCVVSNNCTTLTSDAVTLTVTDCTPPVPAYTAQPGSSACINTDVTYTTESGMTSYEWTFPGASGTDYSITSGGTSASNTVTLRWLSTGSKTVTVNYTNENGCSASSPTSSTATTVQALPTTATNGSEQSVCAGGTVTLSGNTPTSGTGTWSVSSGPSTLATQFSNVHSSAAIFTPAGGAGSYVLRWTIANSPCTASYAEATITVNPLPANTPTLTGPTICAGTSADITLSNSISGTSYQLRNDPANTNVGDPVAGTGGNLSLPTGILNSSAGFNVLATIASTGCSRTLSGVAYVSVSTVTTTPVITTSGLCAGTASVSGTAHTGDWIKIYSGSTYLGYTYASETGDWTVGITASAGMVITAKAYKDGSDACPVMSSNSLTVSSLPTANAITGSTVLCAGTTGVSYTVTTDNSATCTYAWSYSGTGATLSSASGKLISIDFSGSATSGTLTVVETITATGCSRSNTKTITVNPLPDVLLTVGGTGSLCTGTGTNITVDGSVSGIGYQLRNNADNSIVGTSVSGKGNSINLPTGNLSSTTTFNVLATNATTGCNAQLSSTATVTINPLPTATISGTTAVCKGSSAPDITFTGTNGTAPYTFTYKIGSGSNQTVTTSSGNTITVSAPTATAGTFVYSLVSVQDGNGCSQAQSGTASVTVNPLPTASVSGSITVCEGGTAPDITFTGTNGTAPYTFTYKIDSGSNQTVTTSSGNSATVSAPTVNAGVFTYILVSVQDANGCSQAQGGNATVTVNPVPAAPVITTSQLCPGSRSVSGTADPNASVIVYKNAGASASVTANASGIWTTGNFNVFAGDVITAKVTASNCLSTSSNSLTVNTPPSANPITGSTTLCAGTTGVSYAVTNDNSATCTYAWSYSGTGATLSSSTGKQISIDFSGTATSGTLTVVETLTTTGCSTTNTRLITVNALPDLSLTVGGTGSLCSGTGTNITVAGSVSGVNYQLRNNADNSLVGSVVAGTGGSINLPTGNLSNSTTFNILATKATTGCSAQLTGTATITVNLLPTLTGAGQSAAVCAGNGATINLTGLLASSTFTVDYSINGTAQTPVTGVTSDGSGAGSFTSAALTAANNGQTLRVTGLTTTAPATGCSATFTRDVTLQVNALPTIITTGELYAVCYRAGVSMTGFDYSATTGSPIKYTIDWNDAANAAGLLDQASTNHPFAAGGGWLTSVIIPAGVAAGTYSGVMTLTNSSSCSVTKGVSLTIYPIPDASLTVVSSGYICSGTNKYILVAGSQSGVSYQLRNNSTNSYIGNAVNGNGGNIMLNTGNLSATTTFNILAEKITTGCYVQLNSTVTVTVYPSPTLSGASQFAAVCAGNGATINLTGLLPSTSFTVNYSINGTAQTAVNGVTSDANGVASFSTAVLTAANNGQTLRITGLTVTTPATNCTASFTQDVTLQVNPILTAGVSITASPSGAICAGTPVTFTATPTNGGSAPVYQWKLNGTNTGTNSMTYMNVSLVNGDVVTCVMTSNATPCLAGSPATSNAVTMTVNPLPTLTGASQAAAVCAGNGATINLTGLPASSTFTVSYSIDGTARPAVTGVTSDASGAASFTSAVLTAANNGQILQITRLTFTTPATGCLSSFAQDVTLQVNPILTASVSIAASPSATICAGSSVTFTATPVNGGGAPVYQWKVNGTNVGTNSTTYTTTSLANNDEVTCVMTSNATPCLAGSPATSNTVTMTVNPLPVTTMSFTGPTICAGETATVTLSSSVAGTSYQLRNQSGNTNLGSAVDGTGAAINLVSGTLNTTTDINVLATTSAGCSAQVNSFSTIIVYPVTPAPVITTSGICPGHLTVNGKSEPNASIIIYRNGGAAASATANGSGSWTSGSFWLSAGQVITATAKVGSDCVSLSSNALTVYTPPASNPITGVASFCAGTTGVSYSVSTDNSATATYAWSYNGTGATLSSTTGTQITIDFSGSATSGTLTVVETSSVTGCSTINTKNITVNALPDLSLTVGGTGNQCLGTGTNITVAGSVSGVNYQLRNNSGNILVGTAVAGTGGSISLPTGNLSETTTFNVLATKASTGCSAQLTGTATVTVNPLPTLTGVSQSAAVCTGSSATINLTGLLASSTFTVSYSIDGSSQADVANVTSDASGVASFSSATLVFANNGKKLRITGLTVTSAPTNCSASFAQDVTLAVNPVPSVTTSATAAICSGGTTGITLTASAASSFTWTVGTITGAITGASAGSGSSIAQTLTNPSNSTAGTVEYIVTPTSTTGGCAGSAYTIKVTVNPVPSVTTSATAAICSGGMTAISLTASAASTFSWTVGTITGAITGASAGSGSSIAQTLTNPSNSAAGTVEYIVTPTSVAGGGKGSAYNITVTVNPVAVITSANIATICSGTSPNIVLTASVPTTFNWTIGTVKGGITGATAGSGAVINQVLTNPGSSSPGSVEYVVTPVTSLAACASVASTIKVTVNPVPVNSGPDIITICSGTSPALSLDSSGHTNYRWVVDQITGNVTGAAPGTGLIIDQVLTIPDNYLSGSVKYRVSPTSDQGCSGNSYIKTVNVRPLPVLTTRTEKTICSGSSAGITLAATLPSTYTWTVGTITGGIIGASAGSGNIINQVLTNPSGTSAGSVEYIVIPATASGGCTGAPYKITVTVNPLPVLTSPSVISVCSGSPAGIALAASQASTFLWTVGTITGGITGASAGTGNTINQVLTNPSNSAAGTVEYIVTPTSTTGGCTGSAYTITVMVNPVPAVTTSATAAICSGGTTGISLAASVVSNFSWTVGTITGGITGATAGSGSSINQVLTNSGNSTAGTVEYIVTPSPISGGCNGKPYRITVTVDPSPVVTTPATATICSGSSAGIDLTASVASSFTWTVGTITGGITGASSGSGILIDQVLTNPSGTLPGTVEYIVTPAPANGGCAGTPYRITVTVNPSPMVTTPASMAICSGSPAGIALSASLPCTYAWTAGAITGGITGASDGTGNTINQVLTNPGNSLPGTVRYLITPTIQGSGCIGKPYQVTVTVNPVPAANTITGESVQCAGSVQASYKVMTDNSVSSGYTWRYTGSGATLNTTTGKGITIDFANAPSSGLLSVTETITATGCSTINSKGIEVQICNIPPVITSDGGLDKAEITIPENTLPVTKVKSSDPDKGETWKYSITGGADASRFIIDPVTGALSFAVAPDYENPADSNKDNRYVVIVTVTDDGIGNLSDSQEITVVVSDTDEPPFVGDIAKTINEDTRLTFSESDFKGKFSDVSGKSPVKIKILSLPANGVLKLAGVTVALNQEIPASALANLTFDPDPNWNGETGFSWNGSNGSIYAVNPGMVRITVTPVNDPPVLQSTRLTETMYEDEGPRYINVMKYVTDPDKDKLTVTITGNPRFGTVTLDPSGNIIYTPNPNFNGTDNISFQVCDAGTPPVCVSGIIVIEVLPVNDTPVLANQVMSVSVPQNSSANPVDVVSNIRNVDGDRLTVSITGYPGHGQVTVSPLGIILYTPVKGYTGPDVVFFMVCDDGKPSLCAMGQVNITVTSVATANHLPQVGEITKSMEQGRVLEFSQTDFAARFTDQDNEKLSTVRIETLPAHGRLLYTGQPVTVGLVVQASDLGKLTYESDKDYNGTVSFSWNGNDNKDWAIQSALVIIAITPATIYIPEGFSPNGDGINDFFVIQGADKYLVTLRVFNRWGNKVYESNHYRNDWDGTSNVGILVSNLLPGGTYYYTVNFHDGQKERIGYLTIIR